MRKKKEIENAITGKYKSFHPGKVWLDTNGNPIQAHGFSVFYNAEDKTYYWYGENKEKLWEVSLIKYGTGVSGVMSLKIYIIGKIRGF